MSTFAHLPMKHATPLSLLAPIVLSFGSMLGAPAHADDGWRWQLRHGQHKNLQSTVFSAVSPVQWTRAIGGWALHAGAEIEFGQWRARTGAPAPRQAQHLGAMALMRFQPSSGAWRPYAEAGLGVALFDRTQVAGRTISTAFQFSEHLGLGIEWNEKVSLGWRYSHYSNAGIRKPNDGLDMHSLVLGVRF